MRRQSEAGVSLLGLLVAATIGLILLAGTLPNWKYVIRDQREEELLARGGEIADAIQSFQRKNGNALPTSLEALVKGRHLRRLYTDPMTKSGKWRLLRPGDTVAAPSAVATGRGLAPSPSPTPTPATTGFSAGTVYGGFLGVASTSKDKSFRIFNGKVQYNEWLFIAGQPRVVGKASVGQAGRRGGTVPGPAPSATAFPRN